MAWSMNTTEEEVGGHPGGASLPENWPGDDLDLLIVIATSLILILMILTTIVGESFHSHFFTFFTFTSYHIQIGRETILAC